MNGAGGGGPGLAVVIPTMGRDILIRTLESLAAAAGFSELDVVVAGRVPDPGVAARLREFRSRHANVRHLDIQFETGDSSRKKNEGAGATSAPLIAFLDDDVVVAPDWPQRVVEPFADPAVGLASGPSLVPEDISYFARLAGLALASPAAGYVAQRYRRNREDSYPIDWDRVIGCNAAYRRAAFIQVGGFPPEFYPGEEMIAAHRTEAAGWKLVFAPRAWVKHYPRQSPRRFWRQMWTYGATRIRLRRAGAARSRLPLVPGAWVGGTLALAVMALFWRWAACILAADLALYFAGVLAVTVYVLVSSRRFGALGLVVVIPLMHAAYGLAQWAEWLRPNRDFSETAGIRA